MTNSSESEERQQVFWFDNPTELLNANWTYNHIVGIDTIRYCPNDCDVWSPHLLFRIRDISPPDLNNWTQRVLSDTDLPITLLKVVWG